jgi:hypothetical protein
MELFGDRMNHVSDSDDSIHPDNRVPWWIHPCQLYNQNQLKVPAGALSLSDKEDRISQFAETLFVLITCNLLGRATNTRYPSISAETLTLHTFNQIEDQEFIPILTTSDILQEMPNIKRKRANELDQSKQSQHPRSNFFEECTLFFWIHLDLLLVEVEELQSV